MGALMAKCNNLKTYIHSVILTRPFLPIYNAQALLLCERYGFDKMRSTKNDVFEEACNSDLVHHVMLFDILRDASLISSVYVLCYDAALVLGAYAGIVQDDGCLSSAKQTNLEPSLYRE